jgi:hypothetical protein
VRISGEPVGLKLKIFDRSPDRIEPGSAAEFFVNSYLGLRFAIGLVAFTLPFLLVFIDRVFIDGSPVRGSMSAYYHSGAREVFVGGLFMVGGFLLSYMSARPKTYDFVLSFAAGILVILVAIFPTARYQVLVNGETTKIGVSQDGCTKYPGPPFCADIQAYLGEAHTRLIHQLSAGTFVVVLAALCVVFALREFGYGPAAEYLCGDDRNVKRVWAVLKQEHQLWRHLVRGANLPEGAGIAPPAMAAADAAPGADPSGAEQPRGAQRTAGAGVPAAGCQHPRRRGGRAVDQQLLG